MDLHHPKYDFLYQIALGIFQSCLYLLDVDNVEQSVPVVRGVSI
jgi:hypothetical protein